MGMGELKMENSQLLRLIVFTAKLIKQEHVGETNELSLKYFV